MDDASGKIRILIADEHVIFCDSLKVLLESEAKLRIQCEICSCNETLKAVHQVKPDILLLDLSPPEENGMNILQTLQKECNPVRTIVLCADLEVEQVVKISKLGVSGLIMKDAGIHILTECIKSVLEGKYWFGVNSTETPYHVGKESGSSSLPVKSAKSYNLTPREITVIKLVVAGMKTKDIARKLSISEQTVKHHITNIFDKVGVFNRLELTLFSHHNKLV